MKNYQIHNRSDKSIVLENSSGLKWEFWRNDEGWNLGAISLCGELLESSNNPWILSLHNQVSGETKWLSGSTFEQPDASTVIFSGRTQIEEVNFVFSVRVSLPEGYRAAKIKYNYWVDKDLTNWQVGFAYHEQFTSSWVGHLYPFAQNAKVIQEYPLIYVGVPSVLLYRQDFSIALLFGFDMHFDYLNPNSWTGDCGFYFTDGVTPPQFRVGGSRIKKDIEYVWPLHIIFSIVGNWVDAIPELVQGWISLNDFVVEDWQVRTPEEGLELFINGRRKTSLWNPGVGYQLEEGDPEAHFVYIGEQPLSAYFEYLLYEETDDPIWRKRCFEQMDFVLQGQDTDPESVNYGVFHTAYDLGKKSFDSDDRGSNNGYKPDLNAYIARYMLMTWQRVKAHEGVDCQDWYQAAVLAADWVIRQQNADGGLPQVVRYPFVYMEDDDDTTDKYFHKSISSTPGRALAAFPVIYDITGDDRYLNFALELEAFVQRDVEGRLRYTGHHPDLPPDELEEASIWGVIEYWLDKFDRSGDEECLKRAVANAYLAFLWWCPKQLSWVQNPTQCASAEQQHYLQYSIYCYQNRKLECLWRLFKLTNDDLFSKLYYRIMQGVFWTQIEKGEFKGAAHERIADPWLARQDYDEPADFNSMGTIYMGEQILDTLLQILEMRHTREG